MIIRENKLFVDWFDVQDYINNVAQKLEGYSIPGVYGIPRGGLIFAVMLSHRLDIPLLAAPCENCVVIDDIADTGKTLVHYEEQEQYFITTMFYHKQSEVVPEYWYKEKENLWIVYPWEVE